MGTTISELKNETTKDIKLMKPKDQVKTLLEQNRGLIKQALPKHINADRLLRVAQTSVTTTPGLLECYVPSLIGGIIQCSQMGLEPNTVMGHAYLIPFWNNKKRRKDAQVIIGYKGLIDLARRSGQIVSIAAHAVRENDDFTFEYGLEEKLTHKPSLMEDRGAIIAFYAVAHLKDGGYCFEVMSRQQVEKIRDTYAVNKKTGKVSQVWLDHFEEQGRKTTIRRLAKYLPLSIEFATASAMDELAEQGKGQNLDSALEGDYLVVPSDDDNNDPSPPNDENDPKFKRLKVDSAGEVYDQTLHATSREGEPVLNQDGTFRKRRQPTRGAGTEEQQKAEPASEPPPQYSTENVTQGEVLRALEKAKNEDELNDAGDLINELDPAYRELPDELYMKRLDEFLASS